MDVILEHFSHEHPLLLVNELSSEKQLQNLLCNCCQEPITSAAYSCEHCSYYLHNKCGELPHGIEHPLHPQHPLTLRPHPSHGISSCSCDVCGNGEWKWFTYNCADCNFDAHVSCTPLEERPIEHKFHNHPLTFTRRKATFFCDACGTQGEDLSYRCSNSSCEFWIHDTCASTPNTIKRNDHAHSLQLSYSIPHPKRKFNHDCYICRKRVQINYWIYYCSSCTYLAHLKCAKSEETTYNISDPLSVENEDSDLVYVPTRGLTNMMTQFSIDTSFQDDDDRRIVCSNNHFSWIDDDVDCIKKMKNKQVLCDVCIQPIIFFSEPCSKCGECSFIAHKKCTFLQFEILHPSHLHPLTLYHAKKGYSVILCSICGGMANGIYYKCETCADDFCIDVSCATTSLPNKIKHEAHYHPFILQPFISMGSRQYCRACNEIMDYGLEYICVSTTCDFHLHTKCAMLPGTLEHDWDKHKMSLTYPPFDHPEDYLCETCEEFMHPTLWLYHCSKCDHSFHTNCEHRHDWWSKFRFGMTYKFEGHQHNLTSVWKPNNTQLCDCCGKCYTDVPLLDCTSPSCTYQMCFGCAFKTESQRIEFPSEE